ncbi:hypothetical protein [Paraburkholderia sp. GAS348]|uniref:hypothetical protein n=1 Tax=Paraburkholderia sp. GAS348 TaxID=3035132 RepID=UPI003D1A7B55
MKFKLELLTICTNESHKSAWLGCLAQGDRQKRTRNVPTGIWAVLESLATF